jgi:predicted small lipoprotein YifL
MGDLMSRSLKLVTVLVFATLAVSACGKRGALEPPPNEDGTVQKKAKKGSGLTTKDKEGYVSSKPSTEEHRPFVLDGLLR